MNLDNAQFGTLMLLGGMGMTLITLWILTIVMHFLNVIFKAEEE